MTKIFKTSSVAFSAFMIMLLSLLILPGQANAQTTASCCNDLDRASKLIIKNDYNQVLEGVNILIDTKKYCNSTEKLTNTLRDRLANAIFNLTKTLEPTVPESLRTQLRDEMQLDNTLGEAYKPFYDSFIESFNEAMKELK